MTRPLAVRVIAWVFMLLVPTGVFAQQNDSSHWGFTFAAAPNWTASSRLKITFDADAIDVKGTDLHVGIVRGRDRSGEWGVSYVQRRIADGSRVDRNLPSEFCLQQFCALEGTYLLARDALFRGLEVHKFIPFGGSIANRVQIGLNIGGGVGWAKGTLERHDLSPVYTTVTPRPGCTAFTQNGCVVGVSQGDAVSTVPAGQLLPDGVTVLPLFRLEGAVAVRLMPGLKVRVGAGFNFPSAPAFSISASYLIGAGR